MTGILPSVVTFPSAANEKTLSLPHTNKYFLFKGQRLYRMFACVAAISYTTPKESVGFWYLIVTLFSPWKHNSVSLKMCRVWSVACNSTQSRGKRLYFPIYSICTTFYTTSSCCSTSAFFIFSQSLSVTDPLSVSFRTSYAIENFCSKLSGETYCMLTR